MREGESYILYLAKTAVWLDSHALYWANPSFKNISRTAKSSWDLRATTASTRRRGSKSKTEGRRRAVAMTSTAAADAEEDVGAMERT